jgi:hypothetical protein
MNLLPIAAFLPSWFMLAAIVLPIAWLVSEYKGKRWQRVVLGFFAIFTVTVTVSETRLIIPNYTTVFQHSCIERANYLLKTGQSDAVIEEYDQYLSGTTNSFDFYGPAMRLSQSLHARKEQSSNKGLLRTGDPRTVRQSAEP